MKAKIPSQHPFGPQLKDNKLIFSLFSLKAEIVQLHLFEPSNDIPFNIFSLSKSVPGIWTVTVPLPPPETEYLFEVDGKSVLDPYAKALSTPHTWGLWQREARCQLTYDHTFDWQHTKKPGIAKEDLIIYEMHVRGFTQSPSSKCEHPGTYLALIEKIPYLKSLGINAIELLPIHEFDERENPRKEPTTGKRLWNYWGYMTTNFFAPMKRYATSHDRLAPLTEFKTMVREFHKAGIEVILDVVYNHVSHNSTLEDIDKKAYFILNEEGEHTNFSGCGNTLSVNQLATSHLVFSSLHYFAEECQIDGFRFDLAGCFARGQDGNPLHAPPFFDILTHDSILSSCKLILEPWDCYGINLLNHFNIKGCSAWNSSFKAAMRRFIRGDGMQEQFFKDSFLGSSYLFPKGSPTTKTINYVTCHDGFSLHDLVAYSHKHNDNNGEESRDGDNDNSSSNNGIEGLTSDATIIAKRTLQMKNLLATNLLSIGIPMLRMGDEYGHTNYGNNNMYCQDELNWFDWDDYSELLPFIQSLTTLRKTLPLYKSTKYLTPDEIHIILMKEHVVAILIQETYLFACNASSTTIYLPTLTASEWEVLIETNPSSQNDLLTLPPKSFLLAHKN